MNKSVLDYVHDDWIAGHGDVLKHLVFTSLIRELQQEFPQGLCIVDCHAGDGVYDLNQHDNPSAFLNGIIKILERCERDPQTVPAAIQKFVQLLYQMTGCTSAGDLDMYPGSPVWAQKLLRPQDEHRLLDLYVEEVQWIDTKRSEFRSNLDCNNIMECLEFILPFTEDSGAKHPVILIDPDYQIDEDYTIVKKLLGSILEQHSRATVMVWLPLIHNHKYRFSFATQLKDMAKAQAKTGRYYANLAVAPSKFQGSAVLVVNPPKTLDAVVSDDTLHWMANTMHQGKDEYSVEQIMKKKKLRQPAA